MKINIKVLFALSLLLIGALLVSPPTQVYAASTSTALKWSTQPASGNNTWTSVAWSPELGKFVAVARAFSFPTAIVQRIMTSSDGITWTLVPSANLPAAAGAFTAVTWSPGLGMFVAVTCNRGNPTTCSTSNTSNLRVMTSPTGDVWTERTAPDANSTWQSVTWSPQLSLFVAVADGGDNSIMTSSNGTAWTAQTAPEDNAWKSVTWSPGLGMFVAVSSNGANRVMTSTNGVNWTAQAAAEANSWASVTWSPQLGKFVAVSSDGANRVMTSTNGTTWTARTAAEANAWSSVTWSPALQKFAAVASSGSNRIMTSSDGETWSAQAASANNSWNAIIWSPELGTFVSVGGGGSTDGGPPLTSARVMTGSMTSASVNAASNVTVNSATINGDYADSFPDANVFFTGTNVFFRYRVAGSSGPFLETAPQATNVQGAFSANLTSLSSDTTYEFKSVLQWPSASGTQTLESGLQTFDTLGVSTSSGDSLSNTGQNMLAFMLSGIALIIVSAAVGYQNNWWRLVKLWRK